MADDEDTTENLVAALEALIARFDAEIKRAKLADILSQKKSELTALLEGLPAAPSEQDLLALASKVKLEIATLDVLVGTEKREADQKAEQLQFVNRLLFETPGGQRFTQDSPILPSVLIDFALEPRRQLELILTLKGDEGAGHAALRLRQMIKAFRKKQKTKTDEPSYFERAQPRISYIPGQIAVRLYFDEMMRVVLPLTPWWHDIYGRLQVLEKRYQNEEPGISSASWFGFPMPDDDRRRDIFEALMVMRREIDPTADNILEDDAKVKEIVAEFELEEAEREAMENRIKLERNKTRLEYVQQFPQDFSWFVRIIGLIADCFKTGEKMLENSNGLSAVLKRDFDARRDIMNSALIETKQEQEDRISDQATSLHEARQNREQIAGAFLELYTGWLDLDSIDVDNVDLNGNNRFPTERMIWRITKNRPVHLAVSESALTIKADAARRLFDVSCEKITWAILDSGIDPFHPAFKNTTAGHEALKLKEIQHEMQDLERKKREDLRAQGPESESVIKERDDDLDAALLDIEHNRQPLPLDRLGSRIVQTLDFTKLRNLLEHELDFEDDGNFVGEIPEQAAKRRTQIIAEIAERMPLVLGRPERLIKAERVLNDLRARIAGGHDINWRDLESAIVVTHPDVPTNDHGTHVAGILGADWVEDFENERKLPLATRSRKLQGVCPEINLIDVRVFREDGLTDEFELLAAIQYLRWMNERAGSMKVHGANLSLSLLHEVQLFACGQTPICDECNEATALGMVMVAAAGNRGFAQETTREVRRTDHYQSVSVTDPGNADGVITVGATHRKRPHEYGVSYFSSRGPTGDGRMKPDLVAPGEKIMGPTPNKRMEVKDGTSMAAPHVSGAAAMLMARHTELIGRPARIKQILCETATDLGRERYFQGHGLVDALRALQSV